jgi:hypothetical protein
VLWEPSSGDDTAWLKDTDPHVPLGDLLAQGLGEAVHTELVMLKTP